MRHPCFLAAFIALGFGTPVLADPSAEAVTAYDQMLGKLPPGEAFVPLGDMSVPVEIVRAWRNKLAGVRAPRSASPAGLTKWPGGNVYYAFNANVTAAHQTAFLDAVREWETFANIHFIARTSQTNYLMVNDGGAGLNGGNSFVGMVGGAQAFNIGSTSWNRGTIVHEAGHALGLIHEHHRSDRDTYVTIAPAVAGDGNFILIPTSTNNGAYDFLSVMHYGKDTLGVGNITPKPGYELYLNIMGGFGDRALSRGDRNGIALAAMYGAGPAVSTVVTNTKDSGPGSLRAAIYKAFDTVTDTPAATPVISFNIPNTDPNFAGGVFTITPTDRLPAPGARVTIDATTQTTFTGNTNASGPEVVLNGTVQSAETSTYGLGLQLIEPNVTVKGFVIQAFETRGIFITGTGATGCRVEGCYIGTNAAGTAAVANGFAGVEIAGGASGNTIGGTTAGAGNVLSGNGNQGLAITGAHNNSVVGNLIGTNAAGAGAVANGYAGVQIFGGAQGNTVGGTTAAARNVLSGNVNQGAAVSGVGTSNNAIIGNYAGLNAAGTAALPNAFAGAEIFGGATNNTIGGSTPGAGNVLSGNLSQGAALSGAGTSSNVVAGNFIGTNAAGTAAIGNGTTGVRYSGVGIFRGATGNTIGAGNVISGNTAQGVLIQGAGTNNNIVAGNWIGLNAAGTAAVGNTWSGVEITPAFGDATGPQNNLIGGTTAAARNVISGNLIQGVFINSAGTSNNRLSGNFIGTNPAGTTAIANVGEGVEIYNGTTANTIGGSVPGAGNVISGNANRNVLIIAASNNVVSGNFIGLNAAGTAGVAGGGPGIQIWGGSQGNTIGGTSGGRNFISGNTNEGLTISDSGTNANVVVGNSIGTTPGGGIVANSGNGISIFGGPQSNTIGGSAVGAPNSISGNGGAGIAIYNASTANRISGNSITANKGLGIDFWNDGVTTNDAGDGDTGPNNLQNFPVLSSAVLGTATTITGSLNSIANATFRIEFFANPAGADEGRDFVGAVNVTTNASGNATISSAFSAIVPAGNAITATATDPSGNTSEFSATRVVTTTDSDGDGLPNAYETANGLSTSVNDAALDSDGDGMTNAQEFRAGTDPRNPASVFRLAPLVAVGADKTLSLTNFAGRTYRIDFADRLGSPTPWRILADQIPGSGSNIVITDSGAAALPQRFYRAVVVP